MGILSLNIHRCFNRLETTAQNGMISGKRNVFFYLNSSGQSFKTFNNDSRDKTTAVQRATWWQKRKLQNPYSQKTLIEESSVKAMNF